MAVQGRKTRGQISTVTVADKETINGSGTVHNDSQIQRAMQEVDSLLFRITWKQIIIIWASTFCLLGSFVGLLCFSHASVAVQFFEASPVVASFKALAQRDQQLKSRKVTLIDIDMLDVAPFSRAKLERVIHTDQSGHPKTLAIVEESEWGHQQQQRGHPKPPKVNYYELSKVKPKLCSDHVTVGLDDWNTLKAAIQEANAINVERFIRWSRFWAYADSFTGVFDDDTLYYEQDIIITICPGTTLRSRNGPIFINVPNLILRCDACTVEVGGSHFSFGRHATNVLIRGFEFKKARSSSLLFWHDGADVVLEDCHWRDNSAIASRYGAVADVNSTSIVNFNRCRIGNSQRGETPGLASSLSVRN
jgi:hypothetical protein